MTTLSTKAKRAAVCDQLVAIAERTGATHTDRYESLGIVLHCHWPEVSVMIDIDNVFHGGMMAHFYDAKRNLRSFPRLDTRNPVHRRKGTLYRDNVAAFVDAFEGAAIDAQSGDLFEDEP